MAITDKKTGPWGLDQVYNKINQGDIWPAQKNLYAWGSNDYGLFGNSDFPVGSGTKRSSPTQVMASDFSKIFSSNAIGVLFATKADGTLWGWGNNGYPGRLGVGLPYGAGRSSPTQIPGTTWASVDMSYTSNEGSAAAVKTDGTAWVWGWNDNGALGLNQPHPTKYSSPVQLPGTTWTRIQSDGSDKVVGLKTDGTMWSWGYHDYGQLGLNDTISRSSPTQIPGTTWNDIQITSNLTMASKTDGTLWAWGNSSYGMLGQNNITKYSSPVQIPGTWDDWAFVGSTVFGITD